MTFPARLTELLEKAKTSRLSFNDLQDLLTDNAEAIRDLVRAADIVGGWLSAAIDDPKVCAEMKRDANRFLEALAKLEEA